MSEIFKAIEKLRPSRSIWKPKARSEWRHQDKIAAVSFECIGEIDQDMNDDPVEQLVLEKYSEAWNDTNKRYHIDSDRTYNDVRRSMAETIVTLFSNNHKTMHPLKTKIGKWLVDSNFLTAGDTDDVIVKLWKYITANRNDEKHMKNAVQIINVLHNKYSYQYPTPTSRRRRRRRW